MPKIDTITFAAGAKAFGDGEHPTTQMVLAALESIDPKTFVPGAACDMGCGSGILSLAIARKFGCPVVAADLLRESVETTRKNAAANGYCTARPLPNPLPPAGEGTSEARGEGIITAIHSDGFRHADIEDAAPFDLITMNILAEPLLALATDAVRLLAEGGVLILSGIFLWQEMQMKQAYQSLGLELTQRLTSGDWVALVFQKP